MKAWVTGSLHTNKNYGKNDFISDSSHNSTDHTWTHTSHICQIFVQKSHFVCVCWCHFMNTTAQLESQLHCFLFLYPASAIMHAVIITISKIIAFNNIIIDHSSTWSMLIKVMGMSNILSLLYAWLQSSPCERIATFIPYVNNSVRSSNLYTL